MRRFEKNIDDRKLLAARISELTGTASCYTRMPRCAYEIGAFTVERDGSLTAAEGADESVLQTLISENMVGACIEETQPETGAFAQPASGTAEDANAREPEESDPILDSENFQGVEFHVLGEADGDAGEKNLDRIERKGGEPSE